MSNVVSLVQRRIHEMWTSREDLIWKYMHESIATYDRKETHVLAQQAQFSPEVKIIWRTGSFSHYLCWQDSPWRQLFSGSLFSGLTFKCIGMNPSTTPLPVAKGRWASLKYPLMLTACLMRQEGGGLYSDWGIYPQLGSVFWFLCFFRCAPKHPFF